MENEAPHTIEVSLIGRLGLLFGLFFIMLLSLSFLAPAVATLNPDPRQEGLVLATLQGILVFILPSFIYARVFSRNPLKALSLNVVPPLNGVLGIIIIFFIGLPFLNQTIFWNESLSLPEGLASVEKSLRNMEEIARKSTEVLLSTTSFGGMISGVLIIGVLTGLSEEMFFRGSLQRILVKSDMNHHLAIWLTAILFSAMHFQFFGFFPRLLLGGFFGYLFYWSGSLWTSVIAHAFNNSLVVFTVWMQKRGILNIDIEGLGVAEEGFPYIACVSMALTVCFLFCFRNRFFKRTSEHSGIVKR